MQSQWFQKKFSLFCIIDRLDQSVLQKAHKKENLQVILVKLNKIF